MKNPKHAGMGPARKLSLLAVMVASLIIVSDGTANPPTVTTAEPAGSQQFESRLISDDWEAMYVQDAKAGYGRSRVSEIQIDGNIYQQTDATARMRLKRLGQTIELVMMLQTTETVDGKLVDFRTEMVVGPMPLVASGRVVADKLEITSTVGGRSTTSTLPWSDEYRGFLHAEQSLKAKPMKPGQRRSFRALVPVFNRIAETELVAKDFEETKMLDGQRRLLKIVSTTHLDGTSMESTMWVDNEGNVLKTFEPAMKQTGYRTTREMALKDNDGVIPDLIVGTVIRPQGAVKDPHAAQRVRYRLSLTGTDPAKMFPSGTAQKVESAGENVAEMVVRRVRVSDTDLAVASDANRPTADDRNPSSLIQSNDPLIVELAQKIVPAEKDTAAIALALERAVNVYITEKDFSTAFATAAEVAKSRQGDCSEHAVLLTAMARARGLPARTVVGLVYAPSLSGFGYHMWTEIWIGDKWMPLDATLARGGIGGGHIKIAHSTLSTDGGLSAFLPVLNVMGKLSIEVLEEQHP